MTPAQLERLRLEWYRKAGIEDTEGVDPRDALTNKHGSRSQDAQDVAFAGEMAEAARVLLTHPGLSQRERQVWALVVDGASYSRVAREVRCSYSVVSAAIDRCQALMLRPEWESHPVSDVPEKQPGRYVAVHAEGLPGRTACGAGVAGKRVEGGKLVTCKACRETMGGIASLCDPFVDIEETLRMGVENAHRKIAAIHGAPVPSSEDVVDNERAVKTLLNVRASELDYLKNAPKEPAGPTDASVRRLINSESAE